MPNIQSIFLLCMKIKTMNNLLEENIYTDVPMAKNGVPKKLSTLTTLTFVGCGLFLILTLALGFGAPFFLKLMEKLIANPTPELTPSKIADLEKSRAMFENLTANLIPFIVSSIVGIGLRIAGAVQMRKLKKDGFWMYVAGHIIPFVASLALLGFEQTKQWGFYLGIVLAGLFIFLYSRERKLLQ